MIIVLDSNESSFFLSLSAYKLRSLHWSIDSYGLVLLHGDKRTRRRPLFSFCFVVMRLVERPSTRTAPHAYDIDLIAFSGFVCLYHSKRL